ncbi:hypothetical protein MN032_10830 [Agromyces atrinae]|uniref:hypothetical protein n=1 Tax=Agromyces atrinae TaxID=592376 RepID=UPI001F575A68|nr:hypothetical protein [Agromyces atrinae]MCI2958191.1 hypothetical protein [Agromyces atrinae]
MTVFIDRDVVDDAHTLPSTAVRASTVTGPVTVPATARPGLVLPLAATLTALIAAVVIVAGVLILAGAR